MKKITLFLSAVFIIGTISYANGDKDSLDIIASRQLRYIDSIDKALKWETNRVMITGGEVELHISKNFKFLNAEQSHFVLHDIWGNPPREDVLGMIFPVNAGPFTDSSFAFIVTYEQTGFIKDEDADKIDYDEMMKEIKKAEPAENEKRIKQGYQAIHFIGWAQKPYYEKENKVLHWAKEMKFGDQPVNTLNYEVRVLGRKGILSLTAISTMTELPLVNANINEVLQIPAFTAGNTYKDFNSSTDKVAAYTIGSLVAGGILAKAGAFALLGKFLLAAWKFILVGIVALWGLIKKLFTGRSKKEMDEPAPGPDPDPGL